MTPATEAEQAAGLSPFARLLQFAARHVLAVDLTLILLASLCWLPILHSSLIDCWDDYYVLTRNPFVRDPAHIPALLTRDYFAASAVEGRTQTGEESYRPVVTLSYFLDAWLWKDARLARGSHLQSYAEHVLVAFLLYLLLRLFPTGRTVGLLGALLFSVHPVHSETLNQVAYREDILCSLFFLAAAVAHLHYTRRAWPATQEAGSQRAGHAWLVLSVVALLLALFSKEMGVTFPAVVCLLGLGQARQKRRLIAAMVLQGLVLAVFLWVRFVWSAHITGAGPGPGSLALLSNARFILATPGFYIRLLLFGHPLRVIHIYHAQGADMAATGALLLLIAALFAAGSRFRPAAVLLGSFLLSLAPVIGLIKLGNPVADRYLYLPALFFIPGAITLWLTPMSARWRRTRVIVVLLLALLAAGKSAQRCRVWRNDLTFALNLVTETPRSAKAWDTYGTALIAAGHDRAKAERAFLRAVELAPDLPTAQCNLASVWSAMGRKQDAIRLYEEVVALNANISDEAAYNLGVLYRDMNAADQAAAAFAQALTLNPRFSLARYEQALLLMKAEQYEQARQELETVLQHDPSRLNAHAFLGLLYRAMDEDETAVRHLTLFLDRADADDPLRPLCRAELEKLTPP